MDELHQDTEVEASPASGAAEQRERAFIEDRKDLQLEAGIAEKLGAIFLAQMEMLAARVAARGLDMPDTRAETTRSLATAQSLAQAAHQRIDGVRAAFERQCMVAAPTESNPALVAGWGPVFLTVVAASCERAATAVAELDAAHARIAVHAAAMEREAPAESVIAYEELRERRAALRTKQAA